jgi:ferric-dicitrate binding protein FerR (iron transport regulator)
MDQRYLVREIILKYHRGETLTAEEQAILDSEIAGLSSSSKAVWDRVWTEVEAQRKIVRMRPWYSAAAVVVVVVGAVGLYRYMAPVGRPAGVLAAVQRVWRSVAPGHFYSEVVGPEGIEVMDSASGGQSVPYPVTLPDGSKVTLSYGTIITYMQAFGERKVKLVTGDAHFDVAKDPRPFVVESGKTRVQVLATNFNWMHYPGVPDEITLLDGKIKCSRGNWVAELNRGERAVIREAGREGSTEGSPEGSPEGGPEGGPVRVKVRKMERPEETVAWMGRHSVVFDSTELYLVIERMAQYYNVRFHIDSSLQTGRPVSAIVDLERPLAQNLETIDGWLRSYDAHAEERDGVIEVTN